MLSPAITTFYPPMFWLPSNNIFDKSTPCSESHVTLLLKRNKYYAGSRKRRHFPNESMTPEMQLAPWDNHWINSEFKLQLCFILSLCLCLHGFKQYILGVYHLLVVNGRGTLSYISPGPLSRLIWPWQSVLLQ